MEEKVIFTFEFVVGDKYTNADGDIVQFNGQGFNEKYVAVYYEVTKDEINIEVKEFIKNWWKVGEEE